jgi:hypothetical protein
MACWAPALTISEPRDHRSMRIPDLFVLERIGEDGKVRERSWSTKRA